jgi:hypothetical protein
LSACAKCGKQFGIFSDMYNPETVYCRGLQKNLSLNEVYPDNPYRTRADQPLKRDLCVKCYWEVYENAPAQPVRIRQHKCPRCNANLWFKNYDEFEKAKVEKVHICPICSGPYTVVDKERFLPEIYDKPVDIELETVSPKGEKYHSIERTMSNQEYKSLIATIELLKLSRNSAKISLLDSIQGVIDPLSSMNWQMINRRNSETWGKQGLDSLTILFNKYPFQVKKALIRERLLSSIGSVATNCPNCGSLIPAAKVNFCPFCCSGKRQELCNSEPLAMLKLRLAKGEITITQYEELRKIIES